MKFEENRVMIFSNRGGYFSYKVIGDDAVIVHHLLNYKLKNNVVVFTKDALTKVIDILKKYSISFEIMDESRKFLLITIT